MILDWEIKWHKSQMTCENTSNDGGDDSRAYMYDGRPYVFEGCSIEAWS